MKDNDLPVTEEELHAFVDGELPPDRRKAVEAWLAAHPEDATRVGAWQAQSESIRARYLDVAAQPVPPRLHIDRLNRAVHSRNFIAVAAVVAAFLVGGVAGWAMRGAPTAATTAPNDMEVFAKQAIDAHKLFVVEIRHPVEVPAIQSEHLSRWLSKRVGYPLKPPNLQRLGLNLVGGRLLPSPTGEGAAQLMYETSSGERFTLYCARSGTANAAMHYRAGDKTSAVYWVDGNMAYVVSGAAERGKLWTVAETAYEQMERGAPMLDRDS